MNSALRYALEAIRFFENTKNEEQLYKSLISIAEIYQAEKLPVKAIEYYRKAITTAGIELTEKTQATIRMNLAFNFSNNNQPDSANFYYLKSKNYYDSQQDTFGTINCLQQFARFHADHPYHISEQA